MMRSFETLLMTIDVRGVATVTLNRPEKKNALSGQMISDLTEVSKEISKNKRIRVAILRGAGEVFCAGADLSWMRHQIKADRDGRMQEARKLAYMLRALHETRVPLIGALHGGAFGGGIGMACICDVTIAESNMVFGFTETRLGLIPATISPYVIARMGEGKARNVFMSARLFSAKEAKALNIVSDFVSEKEFDAKIEAEVAPYLRVAPEAVCASKKLVRMLGKPIDDLVIEETITCLCDIWETEEAQEGIDAFLNKRKPYWALD